MRLGHQHLGPAGQCLVQRTGAEANKYITRMPTAGLVGHQHMGAGRALGIRQFAVLPFDQKPAKRNHEQHADESTGHGQQRHLQ